jgi:DnaJ-domain-containing protein 1
MAFYLLILLVVLAILLYLLLTQPAKRLASLLVNGGPLLLIGIGALLTIFRRGLIGMPLMFIGIKWWRHSRTTQPFKRQKERKSTVRSSSLEMELDHDTGELDGRVLSGALAGTRLSTLSEAELLSFYKEIQADTDGVALLQSYLDRYHPGWHERAQGGSSAGRAATGSAEMSREEACEVLGVEADASREEILEAWRRLIKRVHPDKGGSAFLTNKLNTAKDVLLGE